MLKNLLVLPDGTEISSGVGTVNAIQSTRLTQSVNSGDELTLGACCAAMLEMTLFTPGGGLELTAGDQVTLYKVDDAGVRTKEGVFLLEQPTRPSANTLSITGYDRVILLDKDLTAWLSGLTDWPYSLMDFANMVCTVCGLDLITDQIPNGDFFVPQFTCQEVTGRQLMGWIGEAACRFCRATADGELELAWYEDSGKVITPDGDLRYYAKGLTYETYQVAPVDSVQIKLADSQDGALWPASEAGENCYVIRQNPIFLTQVTEDVESCLQTIGDILQQVTYTPCQVAIPIHPELKAGSIVDVIDPNGNLITAYIMTRISSGQRDTLESTGSPRRDSAGAANSSTQKLRQMEIALKSLDGRRVVSLINLSEEGIRIKADKVDIEGKVNAEYINALKVTAASLLVKNADGAAILNAGGNRVMLAGWTVDDNSIHHGSLGGDNSMWLCRTGTTTAGSIGGSARQSNWCIAVGKQFGVTKTGAAYASDLHIKGGSVSIANTGLDGGKTVIDASGLVLASEDYTEPGTGTYMRFSTNHIQHYDDTFGATPMIYVGYDADEGSLVKRLEGLWQVDSWESSGQVSSDRNVKYDIQDQPQVYSQIFDKLRPVTFRYKNGTSGRTHTGFIAQDVEDAVLSVGLTTQEFAGVCYDLDENGSKTNYGVRYEEIVSMTVYELQKLKGRVAELEKTMTEQEANSWQTT